MSQTRSNDASRKRARTEEPLDIANYNRYPPLWYEDGNVVLAVEGRLFRVHRSILSQRSAVFRDMFELAQATSTDIIEGCPIVHMPDSAHDLTYFITALYSGGNEPYFRTGCSAPLDQFST